MVQIGRHMHRQSMKNQGMSTRVEMSCFMTEIKHLKQHYKHFKNLIFMPA